MRVRIKLDLDFEGHHSLEWEQSDAPGSVEIPKTALERWAAEREAFRLATLRWKRVIEEVEEQLYRVERERATTPVTEVAAVGAAASHRRSRR